MNYKSKLWITNSKRERRRYRHETLLRSSETSAADDLNVASHALDSGTADSYDCFGRRGCLKRYTPNKTQLLYIERLDDAELQTQTKRNTLINSCKVVEGRPPFPPEVKGRVGSSRSESAVGCTNAFGELIDASLHGSRYLENLSNNAGTHVADRLEVGSSIPGNVLQSRSDPEVNLIDGSKRTPTRIERYEVNGEYGQTNPSDPDITSGIIDTWKCVLETGLDEGSIIHEGRDKGSKLSDHDILSLSVSMTTRIVGLYFREQEEMNAVLRDKSVTVKQILNHKNLQEEVYLQVRDEICQRVSKMLANVSKRSPSRVGSTTNRSRSGTAPKVDSWLSGRKDKKRPPPAEALKLCLLGKSVNASLYLMRHKILNWLERDLYRFYESKSWEGELFPEFRGLENPNHDVAFVNKVNVMKVKVETFQRFEPELLLFKRRARIVKRRVLDDAVGLSFKFLSDFKAGRVADDGHFEEMFSEIDEYVNIAVMRLVSGLAMYSRLNLKTYFESKKWVD